MKVKSPLIGFDIDDVIFYTFRALRRVAREYYNVPLEEPTSFVEDFNGMLTSDEWREVIDIGLIEYDKLEPIDGAIEFLHKYQSCTNNEIVFITSRNPIRRPEIGTATEKLLKKWIPTLRYSINYSKSKVNPKVKIAHNLGIELLIEDRLRYAIEVGTSGIPVLMPVRTWNKRFLSTKDADTTIRGIIPVNDWEDINDIFDVMCKG
jgi:hypothetical protein